MLSTPDVLLKLKRYDFEKFPSVGDRIQVSKLSAVGEWRKKEISIAVMFGIIRYGL